MKPAKKHLLLLISLLVILLLPPMRTLSTAEAAEPITEQQWQQLTRDKAFGYRDKKEMSEVKKEDASANILSDAMTALLVFFSSSTGKAIVWCGFFLLLGYALIKIFLGTKTGLFRSTKKIAKEDADEEPLEHEDLLQNNWERHLQKAIREGNMRMAIRYSYMLLLQMLQENHYIHYRSDKTNYDYYNEITHKPYKQPFRQLTREYEYTWYGDYPVSPENYKEYMDRFNQLKQQITRS
jgi:hypothetical protein